MSMTGQPVPEPFWHTVLSDLETSRALMRVKDYAGALDLAKNAKERIEHAGRWPINLGSIELQACLTLVSLIGELEQLAQAATPIKDMRKNLNNETSVKATSVGFARPREQGRDT
jgi:hypothetical protein